MSKFIKTVNRTIMSRTKLYRVWLLYVRTSLPAKWRCG